MGMATAYPISTESKRPPTQITQGKDVFRPIIKVQKILVVASFLVTETDAMHLQVNEKKL